MVYTLLSILMFFLGFGIGGAFAINNIAERVERRGVFSTSNFILKGKVERKESKNGKTNK